MKSSSSSPFPLPPSLSLLTNRFLPVIVSMLAFTASSVGILPLATPVKTKSARKGQKETSCSPVSVSTQLQPYDYRSGFNNIALSSIGFEKQLCPIYGRKHSNRKQSASITCSAMNARCSASGQTQTVTREAPTITKAPVREPTKTPQLDDGGPGLPPGGDDGGGGGGGGGGGNWSGGFFFFGFLAFLGFLNDKDSEEDYQDSRR